MKNSFRYFLDGITQVTLPTMLIILNILLLIELFPLLFKYIYQLIVLV